MDSAGTGSGAGSGAGEPRRYRRTKRGREREVEIEDAQKVSRSLRVTGRNPGSSKEGVRVYVLALSPVTFEGRGGVLVFLGRFGAFSPMERGGQTMQQRKEGPRVRHKGSPTNNGRRLIGFLLLRNVTVAREEGTMGKQAHIICFFVGKRWDHCRLGQLLRFCSRESVGLVHARRLRTVE